MTTSENKIHIGKEVKALLEKFGLQGPDVGEINITPTKATITVFKRNNQGNKYTVNDGTSRHEYLPNEGEDVTSFSTNMVPAIEIKTYEVRT